jgi:hypothetical protein
MSEFWFSPLLLWLALTFLNPLLSSVFPKVSIMLGAAPWEKGWLDCGKGSCRPQRVPAPADLIREDCQSSVHLTIQKHSELLLIGHYSFLLALTFSFLHSYIIIRTSLFLSTSSIEICNSLYTFLHIKEIWGWMWLPYFLLCSHWYRCYLFF